MKYSYNALNEKVIESIFYREVYVMVRILSFPLLLAAAAVFSANAATVRGVVEDNARNTNPIEGAIVTLSNGGGGNAVEYRDTTDANGAYRITVNDNGSYDITVEKAGFTPSAQNDPSVRITNATTTVVVDLVMVPRPSGTTISGTVTDSASGAKLGAVKLLLQQSSFTAWRTVDSTVSSNAGAYTFDSVTSGTYRIQATLAGYGTKYTSVTVADQAQTMDIEIVKIQTASISGAITDSLSNANLNGALLVLQQMAASGWRIVDSVRSSSGAYAFEKVTAGTYRIQASLAGYASKTTATITVSGTDDQTVNIKLVAVQTGKITGKITGDSLAGPAISGAQVILERISAAGSATAIDTVESNASGVYLFTTVETGLNYDITASKEGYTATMVRHRGQTAGTDTVNIALPKIPTGNVYIKVMKQADSAAISGATVTIAATGATSLTVTSGQNGHASFIDIATGTYTITISATGFNPANRTAYRLLANAKDTLAFYLAVASGGTKVLTGTVTDSATKAAIANARVVLSVQAGGGQFILIDSTDVSGKFSITGIPVTAYIGSVAATCTNYRNYSNAQVTIGQANQADTGRLNITMVKLQSGIKQDLGGRAGIGKPEIIVMGPARLLLRNFIDQGRVSLFGMSGKLIFQATITPQTTALALPANITRGTYIVHITQRNAVYKKRILIP
jgi:large repetitive protein